MKKLIIVRHGECSSDGSLNEEGRKQIISLAKKINRKIPSLSSVLILSSTQEGARESAEIIAKAFNLPYEQYELLRSGFYFTKNLSDIHELVRSQQNEVDILILVTHHEYTESYPNYYCRKVFSVEMSYKRIWKGNGVVIDCSEKKYKYI